jgi:tight adherence protein C
MSNFFDWLVVVFQDSSFVALLVAVLVAAAVFALTLGMFQLFADVNSPLHRRLAAISDRELEGHAGQDALIKALDPFARLLMPRKKSTYDYAKKMLLHAGFHSVYAMTLFYGVRLFVFLLFFCVSVTVIHFNYPVTALRLFVSSLAVGFVGSILPSLWLERRVKSRQRKLRYALPDALDLLIVCVESGLGIAPALQRVADEMAMSHRELATELSTVNAEMRAGVNRADALAGLGARTGLAEFQGLTQLLAQTMQFGGTIGPTLRVYSAEFRDKRLQTAEEQAAKIGTKIIFPLVFCIFPSFFLVAIGPAVIALVDVFSKR